MLTDNKIISFEQAKHLHIKYGANYKCITSHVYMSYSLNKTLSYSGPHTSIDIMLFDNTSLHKFQREVIPYSDDYLAECCALRRTAGNPRQMWIFSAPYEIDAVAYELCAATIL